MSQYNLAQLVQHLDPVTRRALEQATHFSVTLQHSEVTPEHWLLKLLNQAEEFRNSLRAMAVDYSIWQTQLEEYLQQLPKTVQRVPQISIWLAQLLQNSVLEAATEFNQTKVTPGVVLFTFVKALHESLWPTQTWHVDLAGIDLTALKNYLLSSQLKSAGMGQTDVLARYTTHLTELARQGKLDAVIGREREIRQMIDILTRRRQNNPILVGEAGVGKTALVEGLALHIIKGNVPPVLRQVELHSLDLAALQAGAGVQGEFEQRLKDLIQAIQKSPHPIILFIDEAHNLMGAGGKSGQGDAANLLKPLLARGELRTIAATTWAEYKKYIENDAALTRRFEVVRVMEPDDEQAVAMLQGLVAKLEQHHGVFITPDAVTAAVSLSRRYLPDRQLPDKAVSLLDTACAHVQLSQHTTPSVIAVSEQQIQQLQLQIEQLQRNVILGETEPQQLIVVKQALSEEQANYQQKKNRWQQEQQLITELRRYRDQLLNPQLNQDEAVLLQAQYQALLAKLRELQGETGLMALQVDQSIVAKAIADRTGIPSGRLLRSDLTTTLNLAQDLQQRILGQSYAISLLAKKLQTARINLQDPHKPQGVFLLAGSSGIGKTETAYTIAELLYGGRQTLTVINMSEFKEPHKVSMLTGTSAGYVGYGEGGVLTEAIRRRPYGVVLLDEMEKAHPGVQDIFFQVFDKGMLMDGQGREIDCRHTVFLMTSNAGTHTLAKAQPDTGTWLMDLQEELLGYFKPAFLARVTVLPYFSLTPDIIRGIAQLKLQQIVERLQTQHDIQLKYSVRLLDQLTAAAQASINNAREIDQILEAQVLPTLSQHVMQILLGEKFKQPILKLDYQKKYGYVLADGRSEKNVTH